MLPFYTLEVSIFKIIMITCLFLYEIFVPYHPKRDIPFHSIISYQLCFLLILLLFILLHLCLSFT